MGLFSRTVEQPDCTTCRDYIDNGGMCHVGQPGYRCNHYKGY